MLDDSETALEDAEFVETLALQLQLDLTPYNDDGETEADTYRLCIYFQNNERWSPAVRLLDLVRDQFADALDPGARGRNGYDRSLTGFVAELTECLAIAQQALRTERIIGIRNGDWQGPTEEV